MGHAVIQARFYLALLPAFLAFAPALQAHQLDEYLQATLVTLEPDRARFQINLTPGVAVAESVVALVDRDRDGVISTNEAAAYAELLRRDLTVQLDQHKLDLKLTACNLPPVSELRSGWGIIQMEFSASLASLAAGTHRVTLKNRHLPRISVYLINAAKPESPAVHIASQKRNKNQSVGEIEFTLNP